MKRKKMGMAMLALTTAMVLGGTSIASTAISAKGYENCGNDVYSDDWDNGDEYENNWYYGDDCDDYDDDDCDDDDYDDDDCDDDDYDDDDYDDDYDSDTEYGFEFDSEEYTLSLKPGTKSYSECGKDFFEELAFDDDAAYDEVDAADIEWSVDDTSVAVVDDKGYLKAVAPGSVILTASLDGEQTDCEVTVPNPTYKLNKSKVTLKRGKKVKLAIVSNPVSIKKIVKWKSSKKSVATVKKGVVQGKKKGVTRITAKVGGKTLTCVVKVKK